MRIVPRIRIVCNFDINPRILNKGNGALVTWIIRQVQMGNSITDSVRRIVKIAIAIIVVQFMRIDHGDTGILQPLLVVVECLSLCITVIQVFFSVFILPDGGPVCGGIHIVGSIIRPGNADVLDDDGMAGGIPHLHRIEVVQLVGVAVHRKVTGITHYRVFDYHILVLPISYIQFPFLERHFGIIGIGPQHTHIHIDMVPVVAGKTLFVIGTQILRNKDLIVELSQHRQIQFSS